MNEWVVKQSDKVNESESEVTQSCLTLHDPMDCSLPGSSIHGIFQARVLEGVASPGDLPYPGIKPVSSALASEFFTAEPLGKPKLSTTF